MLLGVISQWGSPSSTLQKAFLSLSVWPRRKYTWILIWWKSLLICFGNCQGVPYSHRQTRKRMINAFIMVNIAPICKKLEDKSMLASSKKRPFFSIQSGQEENILRHSFERRAYWFVLKATRLFSIPRSRVKGGWWTLS